MTPRDVIARRLLPRAVVATSRIDHPARLAAAARRRAHRRGRVELFFAFDDPCSAVAVLGLIRRLRDRDVSLVLAPVVARGIADDPAVQLKREYAIVDARRLFARDGIELGRDEPLDPGATAFLAQWAAATPSLRARQDLCAQALTRLWIDGEPADPQRFDKLRRAAIGGAPVAPGGGQTAVADNERLMRRRGPYDTPAAWVHGRWFFAHDRLDQIGDWLDRLGWPAAR